MMTADVHVAYGNRLVAKLTRPEPGESGFSYLNIVVTDTVDTLFGNAKITLFTPGNDIDAWHRLIDLAFAHPNQIVEVDPFAPKEEETLPGSTGSDDAL